MKTIKNLCNETISTENLFLAWRDFCRGKRKKKDVMQFEYKLEENVYKLHRQLKDGTYTHGGYQNFFITDPKQRHIHKAQVRDRVVHHALYRKLYWFYDTTFIPTSFSCRNGRGTHRGVEWLYKMCRKVSKNYIHSCYVLKCDIRKFFNTVNHDVLLSILAKRIKDKALLKILENIIESYVSDESNLFERKGIPLGNLTSQLFANVYMNEFDQFMKHELRLKYYARYTDDFVVVADSTEYLQSLLPAITTFLHERLKLELHPEKVSIRTLQSGIDFLGYIIRPHHRLVRTKTRRRMEWKLVEKVRAYKAGEIKEEQLNASLQSFLGVLSHADAYETEQRLRNLIITND